MTANSIIASVVTAGSNNHATVSEEANAYATDFVSAGVVGTITNTSGVAPATGSFAVNADGTPDLGVAVSLGAAYVSGTPTAQGSQVIRARATTSYTNYALNANASGSTKYDWIYLQLSATNAANPSAAADNVITLLTSRSTSNVTDNGTPPTYGILLAVVTMINGVVTVANADISDRRTQSALSIPASPAVTGWGTGSGSITAVAYNGNRSYSLTTATDNTSIISPGYRLRTTRSVLAPTQSTSLNGTTQYYSKSSPAAMTFTDDFVVLGWVKLSSYADGYMASRFDGTSGWGLHINASGQVALAGFNAGAANTSSVTSYQSIPLNKWVHVTAQLDMSSFTATPTTSYIMIDGLDVPATVARGGTNPTALVQAGNLNIGAVNAGTFFPGKIAQVAIFNAKVTQATIRGYIAQTLAGSETSLISAYSFNNTISDLNVSNANNLTANGAAVATNADSPFGGQAGGTISSTLDYGIVQTITSTTIVCQAAEGCTIPTSGGVASFSYANVKEPYLFPGQRAKWTLQMLILTSVSAVTATINTTTAFGVAGQEVRLNLPIGEWDLTSDELVLITPTAAGVDTISGLSTSASAFIADGSNFSTRTLTNQASTSNPLAFNIRRSDRVSLAATTSYYPLVRPQAALSALQLRGVVSTTVPEQSNLTAENAFL